MQTLALRADFEHPFELPAGIVSDAVRRALYFPGSTIGNLTPADARTFLRRWAPLLGHGGCALIGVDLKKDPARLHAAYNDVRGVTAAFNLNLLTRFNRELGANFNLDAFAHRAIYNEPAGRIEMHLESLCSQTVNVGGRRFEFAAQERMRTEISCKYSVADFQQLARDAGFEPVECWTDAEKLFAVHFLKLHE
jgi:dimethylhistidine N-methyltransferase